MKLTLHSISMNKYLKNGKKKLSIQELLCVAFEAQKSGNSVIIISPNNYHHIRDLLVGSHLTKTTIDISGEYTSTILSMRLGYSGAIQDHEIIIN